VKEYFQHQDWVYISQECHEKQILQEILRQTGGHQEQTTNSSLGVEILKEKLHEFLKDHVYLIVLDDVWTKLKGSTWSSTSSIAIQK